MSEQEVYNDFTAQLNLDYQEAKDEIYKAFLEFKDKSESEGILLLNIKENLEKADDFIAASWCSMGPRVLIGKPLGFKIRKEIEEMLDELYNYPSKLTKNHFSNK